MFEDEIWNITKKKINKHIKWGMSFLSIPIRPIEKNMKDCQQTIRKIYILKIIVFICFLYNKEHKIKTQDFKQAFQGHWKM